ncbi:MAG: TldD/PmbA family protein [Candidatus Heimdallarchaeota archaeon]|nr:TldD/PmbA family protein [Candidatus Heimdallarchaeota archaeon]MCK4770678.1 TldD/PmbA family protein [Candidatus Heimdallarchaeota archaeon]
MPEKMNVSNIIELSNNKLNELDFADYVIETERSNRSQLRFADNQFTIAKNWASTILSIFAVKESRTVATQIEDLSAETINSSIESLAKLAGSLPKNENYMGISDGPFSYPNIEHLADPEFLDFHDKSIDMVESAIRTAEEEGAKRSAGVLLWDVTERNLRSSQGASVKSNTTRYEFSIRSFVDEKSSGSGVAVGRLSSKLDFEKAGKDAGKIAKMSVGGINGEPGKYNIILSPKVAGDIIAATPAAANPFSVEVGFSWLKDKIGENIGPDLVTVYDDSLLPNGLGSRVCDDEGHPTGRNIIVENGVLKGFIHNTSTAKKAGTTSTGNAGIVFPVNSNIFFEPGEQSFEELLEISKDKPTLYITNNWYTRFTSYVDGVFSSIPRDGMFLVENGEIKQPVRELRITDTMLNIFKNIRAMSKESIQIKTWEVPQPVFIPYVLVEDVNLTAATS